MDLKTFDLDAFLREADAVLGVAEKLAPLGGPGVALGVKIVHIIDQAVLDLRNDAMLAADVAKAQTLAALDALQPRLDAVRADTERRLDES